MKTFLRIAVLLVLTCWQILSFDATGATTTFTDAKGTWTIKTDGNTIDISFKPDKNNVKCTKIVFVQTVKRYLDGAVVKPSEDSPKRSYSDPDTTAGGTTVDHLFCEKDPYYNGDDTQDSGTQGSAAGDGSETTAATMCDSPSKPDGFFPGTTTMTKKEFETCAVCAAGTDAGMVYGCIKWKYERTKGSGDDGTVTLTSTGIEAASQAYSNAVALFNTNHTFPGSPMCPEDIPAGNCANRVYNVPGPLIFHVNDNYKVEKAGPNVKKGSSSPDKGLPSDPIGATVMACDYIYVPKGERICLKRSSRLEAPDPLIPFHATFADLYGGCIETVSSGTCADAQECGVRAMSCATGQELAAAAPIDGGDPTALVMYTAKVNPQTGQVTYHNDALSSLPIQVIDIAHGGSVQLLNPGQTIDFFYSGITDPLPPELHIALQGPSVMLCSQVGCRESVLESVNTLSPSAHWSLLPVTWQTFGEQRCTTIPRGSGNQFFRLRELPHTNDPPQFFQHPASQTVDAGGTINLKVRATGTLPLTYQWFRNSAPMGGANESMLTISNAQPANAGSYYAIVANNFGSATSQVAVVTVRSGSYLSIQAIGANSVAVTWNPPNWQLQRATNIFGPWFTVANSPPYNVPTSNPLISYFRTASPSGTGSSFSSPASTIYSQNVVAYVRLHLIVGFNLIANPLNTINNHLNTVLPLPDSADGTAINRFNVASQSYAQPIVWIAGSGWYSSDPAESYIVSPGEGFFINPPIPLDITFVGEVPLGCLANPLPPANNLALRSSIVPQSAPLGDPFSLGTLLFPAEDGDQAFLWNASSQTYESPYVYFDGLGWLTPDGSNFGQGPFIPVATGFAVRKSAGATKTQWLRCFSIQ